MECIHSILPIGRMIMETGIFDTDYDVLDACFLRAGTKKSKDLYYDNRVPGQGKIDLPQTKNLDEEIEFSKKKFK